MKKKSSSKDLRKPVRENSQNRSGDNDDEQNDTIDNEDTSSRQDDEFDSPPSFDTSIGSTSSASSRNNRGDRRGRNSGGGSRLINDDVGGKIRPTSSRDTISTTSMTHFDGNSSTGTLSHGSNTFGHNHHPFRGPSRRRIPTSSRLFNRQLMILSSSTGTSLVLFLFFYLNIFAFTALMSFAVSTFMLIYTSYVYIIYLIRSGELNIFTLLPQSVRDQLLNSSIHDMFTAEADYMENRFLLLYFIPGLSPEQILQMVNRLPQRHRDLVLGPGGLARMFFPSLTSNSNNAAAANIQATNDAIEISNPNNALMNQHLPLPVIEEGDEDRSEIQEVTNTDALRGIFDTARTLLTGENPQVEEEDLYLATPTTSQDNSQLPPDLSWDHIDSHEEIIEVRSRESVESEGSDLGLEISPDDMTGNLQEGQLSRIARVIGIQRSQTETESSPTSPPRTVTAHPLNNQEGTNSSSAETTNQRTTEEERELENEILGDAISTVVNNYYNMAVRSVTEAASSIVDSVAPVLIRTGVRISSVSGIGLASIFSSRLLSEYPVSIMGRAITSRNLSEGRSGRIAVRSLISTLTLGAVTVGTAYFTRAILRRQRDALLNESNNADPEDNKDKDADKGDQEQEEKK